MRRGFDRDKTRLVVREAKREIEGGERRETVMGAGIGEIATAGIDSITDPDGNLYWMWSVSYFDGDDRFGL